MIVVDNRVGSEDLEPLIAAAGEEVEKRRLDYGDVAFAGNNEGGPIFVGVEIKTPTDLITSLINKRLTARQLPGMFRCYDEIVIAVLGRVISSETGSILEWRGRWWEIPCSLSWRQLEAMKMSLRYATPSPHRLHFVNFETKRDLVEWLCVAAQWWGREWVSHKSHIPTHVAFTPDADLVPQRYDPTNSAQVASLIAGVGSELGRRIAGKFPTVLDMANASREAWTTVKGLGSKKAAEAFLFFRERR